MIERCPSCCSEEITIKGMSFIQVVCLDCHHQGPSFSYGTRVDRYIEAIEGWNDGESEVNTFEN